MKKIRQSIRDFVLTNPFFRKLKLINNNLIKPILIRVAIAIVTFSILIFFVIKIYSPKLFNQFHNQANYYFFHSLNLDNTDFKKINIEGNHRVSDEEITKIINNSKILKISKSSDYRPLVQNLIDEIKSELPWVNKITITRKLPDTLNVYVVEYVPFAIWYCGDRKYIIDKDGNSINFKDEYSEMPEFQNMIFLSGDGANIHAKSLFNIFSVNEKIAKNLYSANWVGGRRWDLRFDNGLLVKMPELEINEAWKSLIKIYNSSNVQKLKMIDLRVKDKIYIEYFDSKSSDSNQI